MENVICMELKGIIPAAVLPMTADFKPDLESYTEYITWLLSHDIGGIAVNVDTGEGFQLRREEQKQVLRTAVETAQGKVPIVAGVTGRFTEEALELAQDAKDCGADALLVFSPPVFSGMIPPADIAVTYYRALADTVRIPLVIFQLSSDFAGVEFSKETLLEMLEIEQIKAIKEASFNIQKFQETLYALKSAPRKISFLTGNDHFVFESFLLGADGGLLGLSSMSPGVHADLFTAVQKRDYETALSLRARIQVLAQTIYARPFRDYRTRAKEALVLQGVIPHAFVRPPLLPITDEEKIRIKKALEQVGIL
jgi:4-hydroxy-tetrahydrodipicolinate synthase